ncbi:MAG: hypothetical protein KAJ95_10535 [Gammaproteobacteria bacterium]|nr:hypothetical protein [Gammaproteobacteria bacterium]
MEHKSTFKYGLADIDNADEIQALIDAFTALGGERVDSPDWDILWYISHEPPPELYKNISGLRRINHIPGISVLTDKWELYTNLKHHWLTAGLDKKTDYIHRYFPESWKLPEEKEKIRQQLKILPEKPLILKMMDAANGIGMKLITHEEGLPGNGQWLAQTYIDDPHLINDRKYILQVFLLITNSDPLTVYLYQDGVADLAVQPYSSDPANWNNTGIHIATTILQTHQDGFDLAEHCLTLNQWREHVAETTDGKRVWAEIETLLMETLHAVQEKLAKTAKGQLSHPEQCFELLAVDVMLDSTLKPWLIECNRSAGMQSKYSGELKPALLKDTLGLVLNRRQDLIGTPDNEADPEPLSEFAGFKRLI